MLVQKKILGSACKNEGRSGNRKQTFFFVTPNAQCTPTDWQSAVGDIANCRLRIGVRR